MDDFISGERANNLAELARRIIFVKSKLNLKFFIQIHPIMMIDSCVLWLSIISPYVVEVLKSLQSIGLALRKSVTIAS